MAGYLFSLDSNESLISSIQKGVYSTRIKDPSNGIWRINVEGTFADYCSMREGDNVYFFIKRKIYGIGILTNVGLDCKYLNYPLSNNPIVQTYENVEGNILATFEGINSLHYRFICTFKPSPFFFNNGIDMDELLSSSPSQFKILRAFHKLSFIKFSDDENQAFKNIILRRNLSNLENTNNPNFLTSNFVEFHQEIASKINNNSSYSLSIEPFLSTIQERNGQIRHEMAVEAALIYQLSIQDNQTLTIFGNWDYLSHQVIASPFKPIDYMDKMDVFGYRYIINQKPTISHYLVIEIKKGQVTSDDLIQLMKYVDWVKNEYAFSDYSMIEAFMIGYSFTHDALASFSNIIERKYIQGARPSIPSEWNNVKLVTYAFNEGNNLLEFHLVS